MDFQNEFRPEAHSILSLFQRPGIAYLIPYYQRDYSWDKENIKQLTDDIVNGVEGLIHNPENMRFLGTAITIEARKEDLERVEQRARPTKVEVVIDGQQRLSTFSMLSCVVYEKISRLENSIDEDTDPHGNILEAADYWKEQLLNVFTVNCGVGKPPRKPVIIRQRNDRWEYKDSNQSYNSGVSSYIFNSINNFLDLDKESSSLKESLVKKNIDLISDYIDDVSRAHIAGSEFEETYPTGESLLQEKIQQAIWRYKRPDLAEIVERKPEDETSLDFKVAALSNLFLLCYFFLDRCCITLIEPSREELAFDMFQSLNATGTPLTAIEVFKPLVVQSERDQGNGYDESDSQEHFDNIERMFGRVKSASTKNRRTNQLMTTFALSLDGKKLSNRFSEQRKWIQERYREQSSIDEKRKFSSKLSSTASYLYDEWMLYKGRRGEFIEKIKQHPEADLASTCFLYLKNVNHNIANGHLNRYYTDLINENNERTRDAFVQAVKATAAFFTLWRSTKSTSGLDSTYRRLMGSGGKSGDEVVSPMCWTGPEGNLDISNLKSYFQHVLSNQNIDSKESWISKARSGNLRYDVVKKVCRFCLFVSAHDTIADQEEPGLPKAGTSGCSPYLTVQRWSSDDLQVEHVAPATPRETSTWDEEIYKLDAQHEIGNLTLLPKGVNISASNKGWREKILYYQHLGLEDPSVIDRLRSEAADENIDLSESTTELLREASYNKHLTPITTRSSESWDLDFIKKRTKRINEIIWDRISPWIFE